MKQRWGPALRRDDDRRAPWLLRRLLSGLPQGRLLPDAAWAERHRGIVLVLWLHVPALMAFGLARGYSVGHVAFDVLPIGIAAAAASVRGPGRRGRSLASALGLVTCSAVLLHLWGGQTEGHFHFFVVIPILALYQDWAPFLLALGFVVFHHGVMGAIDPGSVYNQHAALAHPWRWALIHAAFVIAASVSSVVSWRGNEQLLHEPLTGLPGRAVFLHGVAEALSRMRRRRGAVAVLFVDLDRFKLFNDTLGHAFGDALLVATAARLRSVTRRSDIVARLGGDEFAILAPRTNREGACGLATRVKAALDAPFAIDGVEVVAGGSIGLSLADAPQHGAASLLAEADAAMYRAKGNPKAPFVVFEEAMRREDSERLMMESALRQALERNELRLVYQPIVTAPAADVVGFEALLRWDHPQRGAVSPAEFIPLAEQTGLIVPIGGWVLAEACREASGWPAAGSDSRPPFVSVNVSARQFSDPGFGATVASALDASGLDPDRLGIEITETVLLEEADSPDDTLTVLKRLGVRLLLDDFGTGYSSLSYLQRFPIDTLKVDRSFVAGLRDDRQTGAIVTALAGLGEALGMTVVAEGVETEEDAQLLTDLGYGLLQGYHFGEPRPVARIETPAHEAR
jgi:diguanylate cyclase